MFHCYWHIFLLALMSCSQELVIISLPAETPLIVLTVHQNIKSGIESYIKTYKGVRRLML